MAKFLETSHTKQMYHQEGSTLTYQKTMILDTRFRIQDSDWILGKGGRMATHDLSAP